MSEAGIEEGPLRAPSTEEDPDLVQDRESVEDQREQSAASVGRSSSENLHLATPRESLNEEEESPTKPSTPPAANGSEPRLGPVESPGPGRRLHLLFQMKWDLLLLAFTAALFAVTAWFAQATFSLSSVNNLK